MKKRTRNEIEQEVDSASSDDDKSYIKSKSTSKTKKKIDSDEDISFADSEDSDSEPKSKKKQIKTKPKVTTHESDEDINFSSDEENKKKKTSKSRQSADESEEEVNPKSKSVSKSSKLQNSSDDEDADTKPLKSSKTKHYISSESETEEPVLQKKATKPKQSTSDDKSSKNSRSNSTSTSKPQKTSFLVFSSDEEEEIQPKRKTVESDDEITFDEEPIKSKKKGIKVKEEEKSTKPVKQKPVLNESNDSDEDAPKKKQKRSEVADSEDDIDFGEVEVPKAIKKKQSSKQVVSDEDEIEFEDKPKNTAKKSTKHVEDEVGTKPKSQKKQVKQEDEGDSDFETYKTKKQPHKKSKTESDDESVKKSKSKHASSDEDESVDFEEPKKKPSKKEESESEEEVISKPKKKTKHHQDSEEEEESVSTKKSSKSKQPDDDEDIDFGVSLEEVEDKKEEEEEEEETFVPIKDDGGDIDFDISEEEIKAIKKESEQDTKKPSKLNKSSALEVQKPIKKEEEDDADKDEEETAERDEEEDPEFKDEDKRRVEEAKQRWYQSNPTIGQIYETIEKGSLEVAANQFMDYVSSLIKPHRGDWRSHIGTQEEIVIRFVNRLAAQLKSRGKRKFRTFFALMDFMRYQMKVQFTSIQYDMMIDMHLKEGYFTGAKAILKEMIQTKVKPTIYTFNSFVRANVAFEKMDMAEDVLEEMKQYGIQPSLETFNALIKGYAHAKNLSKMHDTITTMQEQYGLHPSYHTYLGMLQEFLFLQKPRQVLHYWNLLKEQYPQIIVSKDKQTKLLELLISKKYITEAIDFVKQQISTEFLHQWEPLLVKLLQVMVENNLLEEAKTWFQQLLSQYTPTTNELFEVMIQGLMDKRQEDSQIMSYFIWQCQTLRLPPSVTMLQQLLFYFYHSKQLQYCNQIIQTVQSHFSNIEIPSSLLEMIQLQNACQFSIANFTQWKSIFQQFIPILPLHCAQVMQIVSQLYPWNTDWDQLLQQLFFEFISQHGIHLQEAMKWVIPFLLQQQSLERGVVITQVLQVMHQSSHPKWTSILQNQLLPLISKYQIGLTPLHYYLILDMCLRNHEESLLTQFAKQVQELFVNFCVQTVNASDLQKEHVVQLGQCLIRIEMEEKHIDKAKQVIKTLQNYSLPLHVSLYIPMLQYYIQSEQFEKVESQLFAMQSSGIGFSEELFQQLIEACAKQKLMDKAMNYLLQMKQVGLTPFKTQFDTILHGYYALQEFATARQVMDQFTSTEGYIPDLETYWPLIAYFAKRSEATAVKQLCENIASVDTFAFTFLLLSQWEKSKQNMTTMYTDLDTVFHVMSILQLSPDKYMLHELSTLSPHMKQLICEKLQQYEFTNCKEWISQNQLSSLLSGEDTTVLKNAWKELKSASTIKSINLFLEKCVQCNQIDLYSQVLLFMQQKESSVNTLHWHQYLFWNYDNYNVTAMMQRFEWLQEHFTEEIIPITSVVYNGLFLTVLQSNFEEACQLLQSIHIQSVPMQKKWKHYFSSVTHLATQCVNQLIQHFFSLPTVSSFDTLLQMMEIKFEHYSDALDHSLLMQCLQFVMQRKSIVNMEQLLDKFGNHKHSWLPNSDWMNQLIQWYSKTVQTEEERQLFLQKRLPMLLHWMKQYGLLPEKNTIVTMYSMFERKKEAWLKKYPKRAVLDCLQ